MFAEREAEAISEALGTMEQAVEVLLEVGPAATPVALLAAGGREIDPCGETQRIVEAVCALSDLVLLEVVEHDTPGPWPQITVGRDAGVSYRGMPAGYELSALVHALAEAGRQEPSLSATSLERLGTLEGPVEIRVYVTPT